MSISNGFAVDGHAVTSRTGAVAASYERVSTRMQGVHGFSLGAQHQSLEDFVRERGWLLPEHLRFRDGEVADASGAAWDLPGLTAMLEAAQRGEFQTLVVPDLDRFARSLTKGLVLEEQLKKYGVNVIYQRVPVDDTPEGRLLKHQLFSFAEYEREKTTLRTTMGRRRKAQLGLVVGVGDYPPYGYRFTYKERGNERRACGIEPDDVTAPIARRILAQLRMRSTLEVAESLERDGFPGPRPGSRWSSVAVHRIATNPVYAGTWVFGRNGRRASPDDEIGIKVPVTPLISREEWDHVQGALAHRKTARRARVPRDQDPYLLRGVLTCGHCHAPLHARDNGGANYRYYVCFRSMPSKARLLGKPVCDCPAVHARDLEAELWRILGETLLNPDYLNAGLQAAQDEHDRTGQLRHDRLAALDSEISKHRKRLDGLAGKIVDVDAGEVLDALLRQSREIERLIERLQAERQELLQVPTTGLSATEAKAITTFAAEVREGLDMAEPHDRRELFELLQIRGKVFADPKGVALGRKHRFRIEWKAAFQLVDNATSFLKREEP